MKQLRLVPDGWPCTLVECPSGMFVFKGMLGFKTEYYTNGKLDAYCDSGEYFCAGTETEDQREKLIVQPVKSEWIDEEV